MRLDDASAARRHWEPWQRAADIAARAHGDQTSPSTDIPYFAHPARVALLVGATFGVTRPDVLAAALLHDVLEKTSADPAGLGIAMGETVLNWVGLLSKSPSDSDDDYWSRLQAAPWQVKLIKMADALDHLNGPPSKLAKRLKSARKALGLLDSGFPPLNRAAHLLRSEIERLAPGTAVPT